MLKLSGFCRGGDFLKEMEIIAFTENGSVIRKFSNTWDCGNDHNVLRLGDCFPKNWKNSSRLASSPVPLYSPTL
jgi:hypothetical protein